MLNALSSVPLRQSEGIRPPAVVYGLSEIGHKLHIDQWIRQLIRE